MTAMLAHYRELFARVRRYPGMFGVHTYRELAAYVDGCDAGTSQLLLEGFHEWLQLRLGQYSPFRWSGIVLQMAVPGWDPQGPRQLPRAQEAAALDQAFDLLDEFLQVREQRDGLKRIFRDFARWERAQLDAMRESDSASAGQPAWTPTSAEATVWVFHGDGAPFASGVFGDREAGLEWIARHSLTGTLTEYQVGDGCYDLAVRVGRFRPSKPHHGQPSHVASFSPGGHHVHVADGRIG